MTPQEALNDLGRRLASVDTSSTIEEAHYDVFPIIRKALNELESLKKHPTADEVCKALSEQLKQKVSYSAEQFYYTIENTECIMFVTETYGDGLWSINAYLPPHLITLIGRFYEGLEVKE